MSSAGDDTPVTLDELADLQAGLLPDSEAVRLRARVAADPAAAELRGVLELVSSELNDVDDEPIPDDVVARLDQAIAVEQTASQPRDTMPPTAEPHEADSAAVPVINLAARRRRRIIQGVGGLAAAAALIGVVVGIQPRTPPPVAGSVPAYGATDLASAWPSVSGLRDLGPLTDPLTLGRCLSASGLTPVSDADLLGARPVTIDGHPGVLLAIAVPPDASGPRVALAVFDPGCGPDSLLAQTTVPR